MDFATTAWSAVPLLDAARPRCRLRSSLSLSQSRRISTLNVSLRMLTTSWKNHCLKHVKYNLNIFKYNVDDKHNAIIIVIVIYNMDHKCYDNHVHGYPCQTLYVKRITVDNPFWSRVLFPKNKHDNFHQRPSGVVAQHDRKFLGDTIARMAWSWM